MYLTNEILNLNCMLLNRFIHSHCFSRYGVSYCMSSSYQVKNTPTVFKHMRPVMNWPVPMCPLFEYRFHILQNSDQAEAGNEDDKHNSQTCESSLLIIISNCFIEFAVNLEPMVGTLGMKYIGQ